MARRTRWALTAALIAVCLAVAVTVVLQSIGGRGSLPPGGQQPVGGSRSHQVGGATAAGAAPITLCFVRADPGLQSVLARTVSAAVRAEVLPLGVSADGATAYVSAWTSSFSGVGALDLASGQITPIQPFGNPGVDQADGSWGGRWLVWNERYSAQSLDYFVVYAWDSTTGQVTRLGQSISQRPGGVPWPSPWHPPAVSGHFVAWAQGYGPGGLVEIRLANLLTGQVRVVRRGHTQPPFFAGELLVWPESDHRGALTTLHGYNPATGKMATLPPVLRSVRGTDFVVSDGRRTAYLSADLTALYYSASPNRAAGVLLRLSPGVNFAALSIGRGSLAWTTTEATYVADTKTGEYVRVTAHYGFAVTGPGGAVLVSDPPVTKSAHPILAMHVISMADFSRSACPAAAP